MANRIIKIAQIGTGHDHASQNFNSLLKQPDIFDVVGYARVEDEDDTAFQKWKDKERPLEELLATPGLEAVTIETYDLRLVKYAQMAADRGLHVFMDKPGSQSCADFENMLSVLKSKGKVFSIGYMYRFNLGVKEAISLVKSGALGEIYSVEAQMSCDHPLEKRQWLNNFQGGMIFFLGCHLVDLIYSIQGIPEEIIPYNTSTGLFGVTSKDLGYVIFKYKNGVSFLKSCASEVGGFERRQLVINGSLGTVELNPLEWNYGLGGQQTSIRTCCKKDENSIFGWWHEGQKKQTPTQDRYNDMLRDFYQKICNVGMRNEDYVKEARVHRLVLAACGIECDYKGEICL